MRDKAVIIDLDGSLCDANHRLHHIKNGNKNWSAFFKEMVHDSVNQPVRELGWLYRWSGYSIIFLTGRPEDYRKETEDWLREHFGIYDELHMRDTGNNEADYKFKEKIYENDLSKRYDIFCVIEDRPQVCEMWKTKNVFLFDVNQGESNSGVFPEGTILHMIIGPSGAGKTTYVDNTFNRDIVVSSDRMRELVCGDWTDQSRNDEVFSKCHSLVKHRLHLGLETVFDATNIKRKDRIAIMDQLDKNVVVNYHVIDRPLEEKIHTGGWRNNVDGLIERHHHTMQQNLKDILNGDGYENVSVADYRR